MSHTSHHRGGGTRHCVL